MRKLTFVPALLIALFVALPALAQDGPAKPGDNNFPGIVYNMCRGGGFAYELEPEYAAQRDATCAAEAARVVAELPQRATDLEEHKKAIDEAKARTPAASDAEMNKLIADYQNVLQRLFFVDYCMQKNATRYAASKDGACGYVDNRLWSSRWRALAFFLMSGPPPVARAQEAGNLAVTTIFNGFFKLPAPQADVVKDLRSSGFVCDADKTSCRLLNLLLSYHNSRMNNFGGYMIQYSFTVANGQITAVTGTLEGKSIP